MLWGRPDTTRRRIAWALGVYFVTTAIYFAFAARSVLTEHTPWNHYALLADCWLHGRFHLLDGPPVYAGNNDFARFGDKSYVAFPPFPAVLVTPLVYIARTPERVQDGQFFIWLAGVGPSVLFLVLEKLRRLGVSTRSLRENLFLTLLFAFGTVYFFTAEQGTVWYAAHVVATALCACFVLFALDAERPVLAGSMLALVMMTRPPIVLAGALFAFEAVRVSRRRRPSDEPSPGLLADLDGRHLARLMLPFLAPLLLMAAVSLAYNRVRFGDPFESGYRFLDVIWRTRIEKWGLFSYHYLGRNLGVILTSLPWFDPGGRPRLQVSGHGLALWLTTPGYLWLLWPRTAARAERALTLCVYLTAALVALPTLFYQNTGWVQFGYRFSNDYAVLLFVLLALGGRKLGGWFAVAAVWAVLVNALGAATFNRAGFQGHYANDRTHAVIHQRDG